MNRRCPLLVLLLLFGAVGACAAGEIVLSAPQSEYFFQVGEEAEITLDVDNRVGTNVPGMLTVAVVPADAAQGGGRTQTKSLTIFRDLTAITVDAGAPDAPATFTLKVSFAGSDGQTAVLPEILIHFLGETSSIPAAEPAAQVTSSAAVSPGVQAQSGRTAIDRAVQAGQTVQDAAALREAMAAEDRTAAAATENLLSRAMADPTVADLDGRLRAEGFARTGNTADPAAGTFLFSYQRDGGTGAQISGAMDDDLRFARLDTAASLGVPALLAGNQTFYDYMSQLTTEGLPRGGTTINATHQSECLAFSFGERAAFINATIADGAVQEVSLQRRFNWIPLVALMVGLVGAFALAVRRRQMGGAETPEHESPAADAPSPTEILALAEERFAAGEMIPAYRGAARALRRQIALAHGSGSEITDGEALALLGADDPASIWVETALDICSRVAFAGREPESDEFKKISREIREYLGEARVS